MTGCARRAMSLAALVAVAILSASGPADAQSWTKLYSCRNRFHPVETFHGIRAKLTGYEIITNTYHSWAAWNEQIAYLPGVVWLTQITFAPAQNYGLGHEGQITVGWETSDNSCQCQDLRWLKGWPLAEAQAVVNPQQTGGVPGGGVALFDLPSAGDLTVVITNDNPPQAPGPPLNIDLSSVQCAVSTQALNLWELSDLLAGGGSLVWSNLRDKKPAALAAAPPAYPPLDPKNHVKLPDAVANKLRPQQYTSFEVPVPKGQAFIMRGSVSESVKDPDTGEDTVVVVLEWIEQVTR